MLDNKIKKSRRGLPRHTKNPFLNDTSLHTKTGIRRITTGKDRLAVVNENTGEQVGHGGFFQSMEVDKTQFVKLYVDGVSAIEGLSSSGKKVFKILYLAIRDNKDTDTILMSFDIVDQEIVKISRTTYFKGMKELADKKFIAETMIQNYYFINPDYMFNGDRLTFMKTYYLKDKNTKTKKKIEDNKN
ncbi:replication/maintenance protein RepL [Escherichia coli]|uniref:replication/maintenance protein RepL n=2 Tax=Escherichia coli TaxID=562 RepID=UPI0003EE2081|nr:replication/maintenance protein RepL [Escherichia coli]EAA5676647.1 replication protein [Escherichia coli]EEU9375267.1 replication protein [Escherichia coli]EEW5312591.1 replication protein [Escherichia coli]EEX0489339.1 replication protein [Escherichia coli]EEY7917211.1 replication protein [Escherichia coli]